MSKYVNPIPTVEEEPEDNTKDNLEETQNIIENEGIDYTFQKSVFFAFIDVLGFKKEFDEHRDLKSKIIADEHGNSKGKVITDENRDSESEEATAEEDVSFAKKFGEVFKYYFDLMNASRMIQKKSTTGCYAGQTSDSLYFYCQREDFLLEYIKIFLHFNLFAMSQNVFFRGGISKGNLFIKDPYQFYGESVIFSYLLESTISKNPMVVVDNNTYESLQNSSERELLFKKDNSGRYYLDIFAPLKKGFKIEFEDEMFILKEIDEARVVKNIKNNKKKFEYDARNYGKYVFLEKEYESYREKITQEEK